MSKEQHVTTNETILRDALTEALALITVLQYCDEPEAHDLLKVAGGPIEARGLAALRSVDTSMEDVEGPECCGCAHPVDLCPGCEYPCHCSQRTNRGEG